MNRITVTWRSLSALLLATAVWLVPAAAFPCGAVSYELTSAGSQTEENAAIDAQRAVIRLGDESVSLHVQLQTTSPTEGTAWVLPVAPDAELGVGDPELFRQLDKETRPEVTVKQQRQTTSPPSSSGGGFGCGAPGATYEGGARSGGSFNDVTNPPVEHFEGGRVGDYTYDIIGATDGSAVETWLEDNNYHVPDGIGDGLQQYLDRGMRVAAVELSVQKQKAQTPDPLVISRPVPVDEKVRYPLALSALSARQTTPLLVYVFGNHRYGLTPYAEHALGEVADEMGEQVRTSGQSDYDRAVDHLRGSSAGYVPEYARNIGSEGCLRTEGGCPDAINKLVGADGTWLTRLYARVPKDDLEDITLRPTDTDEPVEPSRTVQVVLEPGVSVDGQPDAGTSADAGVDAAALPWVPFFLMATFVAGSRGRRRGRGGDR